MEANTQVTLSLKTSVLNNDLWAKFPSETLYQSSSLLYYSLIIGLYHPLQGQLYNQCKNQLDKESSIAIK